MLIEMHCHTLQHSSCSKVSAVELVQLLYAKGLQGLVLTDHHYLWPREELADLCREAEVPPDFIIMSGQETNVPVFGDVLIYGAPTTIPRGTPLEQIRKDFPQIAIVWAHPYRDGRVPTQELLCSPHLDAVEIFNSNHTVRGNSRGLQDWHRYRFIGTGGTDTHGASYAGIYPTLFDHPLKTVEELADGIRNGHCRPFLKEIARKDSTKVIEVTIGTQESEKTRESLIIRSPDSHEAWSSAERAFRIMSAIAGRGFDKGIFRVPQPIEKYAEARTLVEKGIAGESLFDRLQSATATEAEQCFRLSAQWLAKMHGLRLRITTAEEFLSEEQRRLERELARFAKDNHPYTGKVTEIIGAVQAAELELVHKEKGVLIQGHGDYHPKNIIIGHDDPNDQSTIFVAAIDFERSQLMPRAFDVGWFLAQTHSMLSSNPKIRINLSDDDFLAAYIDAAGSAVPDDFYDQVELFRARANISIAAFFIKLKLGDGGALWRILVESERALAHLDF